MSDLLNIPADLGKGGAGIAEPLNGVTVRDLLANHRARLAEVAVGLTEINALVAEIVLDGANVQAVSDTFTATNGQTIFPLTFEPLGEIQMRVNGSSQTKDEDFEIAGPPNYRQVLWVSSDFFMHDGDKVTIFYLRVLS